MEDLVHGIRVYYGLGNKKKDRANMVSSNSFDAGWDSGAVSAMCNMKSAVDYYEKLSHCHRKSYNGKGGEITIQLSQDSSYCGP